MDRKETLEQIDRFKKLAYQAMKEGNLILASQYLLDMNNLLPKHLRVNMPPPPRPEDYF